MVSFRGLPPALILLTDHPSRMRRSVVRKAGADLEGFTNQRHKSEAVAPPGIDPGL